MEITKINANSDLPILLGNQDDISHPIKVLFFPDETGVYELLDLRLNRLHYLWAKPSLLLLNRLHIWINVEAMHSHLKIKPRHILVVLRKTSIYSRTRDTRSSILRDAKLSLMKMSLGLASYPRLI